MSLVGKLIGFGLRQVIGAVAGEKVGEATGEAANSVIALVEKHFTDHSQTLQNALASANHHAWQALRSALAGDGWLDKIVGFFASGDDKSIREEVRLLLKDKTISYEGTSADFRKNCLSELKEATQAGLLTVQNPFPVKEVARRTANFQRFSNPKSLVDGAVQVMVQITNELPKAKYPNLVNLLRQRPSGGLPLLVAAFLYFFRREVEKDNELAHGLFFDEMRQLSASQVRFFARVETAFTTMGGRFDQVLDLLGCVDEKLGDIADTQKDQDKKLGSIADTQNDQNKTLGGIATTQAQVLKTLDDVETVTGKAHIDILAEVKRFGSLSLTNSEQSRHMLQDVLNRLSRAGAQGCEPKQQDDSNIRKVEERTAVNQSLARIGKLPAKEWRQAKTFLNNMMRLQQAEGWTIDTLKTLLLCFFTGELMDSLMDTLGQAADDDNEGTQKHLSDDYDGLSVVDLQDYQNWSDERLVGLLFDHAIDDGLTEEVTTYLKRVSHISRMKAIVCEGKNLVAGYSLVSPDAAPLFARLQELGGIWHGRERVWNMPDNHLQEALSHCPKLHIDFDALLADPVAKCEELIQHPEAATSKQYIKAVLALLLEQLANKKENADHAGKASIPSVKEIAAVSRLSDFVST